MLAVLANAAYDEPMSAEAGPQSSEAFLQNTDERVRFTCEAAIKKRDPGKRINILQKLMATAVEENLSNRVERIHQCLHEDFVMLGPNYYEEHSSQAWRDVAYNGLLATLVSAREYEAACNVMKRHKPCIDEHSEAAKFQGVHTFVEGYAANNSPEQVAEYGFHWLKQAVTNTGLSRPDQAKLTVLTEHIGEREEWYKNPLRGLFERTIEGGKLKSIDKNMKTLFEEAAADMSVQDEADRQESRCWTPGEAAQAMRTIRMNDKAPREYGRISSASPTVTELQREPQMAEVV